MATVYANIAINMDAIDLNSLVADNSGYGFANNTTSPLGTTFPSGVRFDFDSDSSRAYFLGNGFTYDLSDLSNPKVTGGSVEVYFQTYDTGTGFATAWGFEGFSYSAVEMYNAAVTVDTADENAIVTAVLAGNDTMRLSSAADVGNGYAGNDNIKGVGGADTLNGGAGNDSLDGGAGFDRLVGGDGNDRYQATVGDTIVEDAGPNGGTADLVVTGTNWTLAANVERLTLMGANSVNGTGNGDANVLSGNKAANNLNGGGGNDTLNGVGGNDTLVGGAGDDNLNGQLGNDTMAGGDGKDVLLGAAGADTFLFNAALSASTNVDTIRDLAVGVDTIALDDDIFTAFSAANQLVAGDIGTKILYTASTGALFYDADGVGGSAAVQFAKLGSGTHPTLSNAELLDTILIVA